jgi:hypothetical protein
MKSSMQRAALSAVLLFLVGLWLESARAYWYLDLSWDNYRQMGAAQNQADGFGLVLRRFDPRFPEGIESHPVAMWPPGFSWLAGALFRLGLDAAAAARVLNLAAGWIYLVAWFGWLVHLRRELGGTAVLIGMGFGALGLTPLWFLPCGDRLTLALFLPATLLLHRLASRRAKYPRAEAGLCVLLFAAVLTLRYAYWPLALCFSLLARRDKRLAWAATGLSFIVGAGILLYLGGIQQKGPDLSLHWENLLHLKPFPAFALGLHRGVYGLGQLVGHSFASEGSVVWGLAAILAAVWAATTREGLREGDRAFHTLSSLVVTLTAGFIVTASLLLERGRLNGAWVTPVKEARYFAPCLPFLALGLLFGLRKKGPWRAPALGLLALSLGLGALGRYRALAPESLHGVRPPVREAFLFRQVAGEVRGFRRQGLDLYWVSSEKADPAAKDRESFAVAAGAVPFEPEWLEYRSLGAGRDVVYSSESRFSFGH